jgi:hypothetical protein
MATEELHIPRWRLLMRALYFRNYRLFFEGQIVSLIGASSAAKKSASGRLSAPDVSRCCDR